MLLLLLRDLQDDGKPLQHPFPPVSLSLLRVSTPWIGGRGRPLSPAARKGVGEPEMREIMFWAKAAVPESKKGEMIAGTEPEEKRERL